MEISWVKRLLSYFYVVTLEKIPSKYNPGLCLQLEAGKLLLNTKNANYSFGNLHKVFEQVFIKINLKNNKPEKVLILGLGLGSVIDIFEKEYKIYPNITAIEIDPAIVEVMNKTNDFSLKNTKIICGDASVLITEINEKFDLIVVDLFIDLEMPDFILNADFVKKLRSIMSENSTIIINCIVNNKPKKAIFDGFKILLSRYFNIIKIHEVMGINKVVEVKN